jgi:hypothetical protein
MPGFPPVRGGMPHQRIVAAADVAACRTAPQMHPPAPGGIAFDTTGAARWNRWIDRFTHVCELTVGRNGRGTSFLLAPIKST